MWCVRLLTLCSLCIFQSSCARFNNYETTTTSYELPVQGSNPIKIIEGEPMWKPRRSKNGDSQINFQHRSLNSNRNRQDYNDDDSTEYEDESIEQQRPLNSFLQSFNKHKNNEDEKTRYHEEVESEETDQSGHENEEKLKSWHLLSVDKHINTKNKQNQRKKQWVSLEPVPWSVSKISKWESFIKQRPSSYNHYPNDKVWDNVYEQSPFDKWSSKPFKHSAESSSIVETYKPLTLKRPYFEKPTPSYEPQIQIQQIPDYITDHRYPSNSHNHDSHTYDSHRYDNNKNCNHDHEIITDGMPPNFPSASLYENRRLSSDVYPDNHPFNGKGEWVLLSTTKGYKVPPNRQRSMKLPDHVGDQIDAHRAVRLTVLPPLKNSKVNMTTSHGGLLQVESTFQTVEQAQKQYARKNKKKNKPKKQIQMKPNRKPNRSPYEVVNGHVIRQVGVDNRRAGMTADSSAVLAAVGAGMIPATMAMLVPIALTGRKRRDVGSQLLWSNNYANQYKSLNYL